MTDLFDKNLLETAPLAERMRARNFSEYFGQQEILGEEKLLRRAIENDDLPSMIFWGPPGSGKTTLANVIAETTNSNFVQLSAISSGKKDLIQVVKDAQEKYKFNKKKTILFIDEIHRWNKAQQDALLPYVEKGTVTLIGATTENPSFEVIPPLLSRSRVYVLKPLDIQDLKKIISVALKDKERGFGNYKIKFTKDAKEFLIKSANGDARTILNALEVAVKHASEDSKTKIRKIDKKLIEEALQHRALLYDKKGDEHYNVIYAFIKSLRGSDVDASIYWLARMLAAGEDPKFIARRMIIFASEDIGNAHSMALTVANAVFSAVEKIGMPECRINLAQGVVYLARAPKSNKSYMALCHAEKDVKETMNIPVPLHLRNAPTSLMKNLDYGKDYKYPHDDSSHQEYLPEELKGKKYYK